LLIPIFFKLSNPKQHLVRRLRGLLFKSLPYDEVCSHINLGILGFIPNWSVGEVKSEDRTEPPVGARVLLELFRKFNDKWVVEALFDDLLDWNDWFMENRLLQPFGLIGLGSHLNPCCPNVPEYIRSDTMQGARWESGLDNSPMYDGELFDNTTHMMQMYDVGMSSLVAQEAFSLAELADLLGKDQEVVHRLRERGEGLMHSIIVNLWDETRQIFANRYRLLVSKLSRRHIGSLHF
jgi:hypothetical protein